MKSLRQRFPLLFELQGFRWLWLSVLVSKLGDWLGFVALNLYVLRLTGSATALAGVLAVEAIPSLLIGPFAGVVVDRFSRRKVILVANFVAAATFAMLPFTTELWHIYILALLTRLTTIFADPARRALVPDLVGNNNVLAANSALSVVMNLALIVGPTLAGLLVASSGPSLAFWINAASFLLANLCIARITGEISRTKTADAEATSWLTELKVGLRYALDRPALKVLLTTTMVATIAGASLITIEVIYISNTLGGGEKGYGFMLSIAGLGALTASTTIGWWTRRFGLTNMYAASVLVTGLMFFPYANIPNLWFVIVVAGLHTIPWVMGMILVDTLLQQWVEDDIRGRIFSLLDTERSAGQVLVAAIFAPLVDVWGPAAVLNMAGVIYTLAGIYVISQLGVLRSAKKVGLSEVP